MVVGARGSVYRDFISTPRMQPVHLWPMAYISYTMNGGNFTTGLQQTPSRKNNHKNVYSKENISPPSHFWGQPIDMTRDIYIYSTYNHPPHDLSENPYTPSRDPLRMDEFSTTSPKWLWSQLSDLLVMGRNFHVQTIRLLTTNFFRNSRDGRVDGGFRNPHRVLPLFFFCVLCFLIKQQEITTFGDDFSDWKKQMSW